MSLFRTLQISPATITIFHNAKVPASAALYKLLDRSYFELNNDKNQFHVDLMANQMPTHDQFTTIFNQCLHTQSDKQLLTACFPFLNPRTQSKKSTKVTVKSPLGAHGNIKLFSEGEYAMVYEAFNSLAGQENPEVSPSELFLAPLVVDWDQNLIANDELSLSQILQKYNASGAELSAA